jgi:hypothetical protein
VSRPLAGLAAALCLAASAHAQNTHLLVVTGLSGEPRYAAAFARSAAELVAAAGTRWGARDSSVVRLDGDAPSGPTRATRDAVLEAVRRLGERAGSEDVLLIVLLGHGSQQGDTARLSLPGPDLTARDLAGALAPLARGTVVVVNAASASGDFLPVLSGPRRVIVTATKSGFERNAPMFGEHFVAGLAGGAADADKDGRISIAEAFVYARREVARRYQSENRLLTEHAQLDDNGDRAGSADLTAAATDGALARAVAFALAPEVVADDPRAAPLLAERRRLETAVAEHRQRKGAIDSAAYERELERLLVALAETTRALRALERKTP